MVIFSWHAKGYTAADREYLWWLEEDQKLNPCVRGCQPDSLRAGSVLVANLLLQICQVSATKLSAAYRLLDIPQEFDRREECPTSIGILFFGRAKSTGFFEDVRNRS